MKVTVLVAVYNAEEYLRECLDSLRLQTHTDLEVMCVDDCSTDSSLAILNEYAGKDNRFHAIHLTENQGQAKARNIAISQSTGDLFCFLDSDDWFAPDSIEKTVKVFEQNAKADCVLFRLIKTSPNLPQGEECHPESFTYEEYRLNLKDSTADALDGFQAFRLSLDWSIHGVYMVRARLQHEILYDDMCRTYSDDNTTRLHYLRSHEVCIGDGIYYYRQHPGSTSTRTDITHFNFLRANEHMQQMLRDMKMDDRILSIHEQVRFNNLLGCYLFYCRNRRQWSKADCTYALNELKRTWHTIERQQLTSSKFSQFGYMPCCSWWLFRIQEEIFYSLRKLLGKEK